MRIKASTAIPKPLRSRIAANQASAVGSLRTLNTANITYASTYNTGYSSALSYLGPAAGGGLPQVLGAGEGGRIFRGAGGPGRPKRGAKFPHPPPPPENTAVA